MFSTTCHFDLRVDAAVEHKNPLGFYEYPILICLVPFYGMAWLLTNHVPRFERLSAFRSLLSQTLNIRMPRERLTSSTRVQLLTTLFVMSLHGTVWFLT